MKLLVAALESELVGFPAEVAGFDRLVTGPGKLLAAVLLTQALERNEYDEIVVVGTGGAIDPALEAEVYEIGIALQHDTTDIEGVVGNHVRLPTSYTITDAPGSITIATGDHFVDDAEAVTKIRPLGAQMVDMEIYAYAFVADLYRVPLRVFKAVSDRAQDDAIVDWRAAVTACSHQLWARFSELYDV